MTEENDEITNLKSEIIRLQRIIDSYKSNIFNYIDLGLSSHVSCAFRRDLPYGRTLYRVTSKKVISEFIEDSSRCDPEYLKESAKHAEYTVKNAFMKEAFYWLMETEHTEIEGMKFYLSTELPTDYVIIHPALLAELKWKLLSRY